MKMRREKKVKLNIRHSVGGAPTKVKEPREQSRTIRNATIKSNSVCSVYVADFYDDENME